LALHTVRAATRTAATRFRWLLGLDGLDLHAKVVKIASKVAGTAHSPSHTNRLRSCVAAARQRGHSGEGHIAAFAGGFHGAGFFGDVHALKGSIPAARRRIGRRLRSRLRRDDLRKQLQLQVKADRRMSVVDRNFTSSRLERVKFGTDYPGPVAWQYCREPASGFCGRYDFAAGGVADHDIHARKRRIPRFDDASDAIR
jgi:hypothetical protein